MIMAICDRVISSKDGSKDCLRSIIKRLNHQDPHVVMQAIVVSNRKNCFILPTSGFTSMYFTSHFRYWTPV